MRTGGTKETRGALGSDLFRFFPLLGGFLGKKALKIQENNLGRGTRKEGTEQGERWPSRTEPAEHSPMRDPLRTLLRKALGRCLWFPPVYLKLT